MDAKNQQYLADHAQKPGVTVTPSGLQYRVLHQGDGPRPAGPNSEVEVHYRGQLIDGTVFDSSYDRGETVSFFLNRVIPGWTEGVQLMNTGSKFEFAIPPDLGYGAQGVKGVIPPNAVLIFEVELVRVWQQ